VKWVVITLKAAISGVLIWLLLRYVDLSATSRLLRTEQGIVALGLAIAALILQAGLAGVRLRWIMALMDDDCSWGRGFAIWMVGLLVSQVLITFIAGDAARIWQLALRGHRRRTAAKAILLERAIGFAILLAMVLACVPLLLARTQPGALRTGGIVLAALCVGGLVAFVGSAFVAGFSGWLPARLRDRRIVGVALDVASTVRHLGQSWALSLAIALVSALMHLCNVAAIFAFVRAAGADAGFVATAAAALPATLIMLMPISLAGWGVREGALIVTYGLFGVPAETALAASVGFGLALLIASFPGVLFIRSARIVPAG
jgi:uncharacterized membrane protein YbhN (UPF0104 family)